MTPLHGFRELAIEDVHGFAMFVLLWLNCRAFLLHSCDLFFDTLQGWFTMTSSNGNIFRVTLAHCEENSPVTGEFSWQSPVMRSFDVFFGLRLNKRLSKQSRRRWFETPSRPLWRHCNVQWPRLSNCIIKITDNCQCQWSTLGGYLFI